MKYVFKIAFLTDNTCFFMMFVFICVTSEAVYKFVYLRYAFTI